MEDNEKSVGAVFHCFFFPLPFLQLVVASLDSVSGWCQCVCQLVWWGSIVQSDPGFLSCGFKWCGGPAGDVHGLKKRFQRPHSDMVAHAESYTQV